MCRRLVLVAGLAALGLAVAPAYGRAERPVPPRDCGMLTAKGKQFNIKADQLRCKPARRYAKAFLARADAPSGYECRTFGTDTRIKFRCSKGTKVLFAIRR